MVSSRDPHASARAWRTVQIGGYTSPALAAVSCPSAKLCVALGSGDAYVTTRPSGKASGWSTDGIDAGDALTGVACPSAQLCLTAENGGNILYTTDPAGDTGRWSVATSAPGGADVSSISCPGTTLCVAVDRAGNVLTSTDPAGGPGAWSVAAIDPGNPLASVSCPTATFCAAVDGVGHLLSSANPTGGATAWSASTAPAFSRIACASSSVCVGGGLGVAYGTSAPTGGSAGWTPLFTDSAEIRDVGNVNFSVDGVACPSATLCLAVDNIGNVFASTAPTTAGSWSGVGLEPSGPSVGPFGGNGGPSNIGLNAIACASTQFCTTVDTAGRAFTSITPGQGGWTRAPVGPTSLTAVSCPTDQLCVAVDGLGNAIVGH